MRARGDYARLGDRICIPPHTTGVACNALSVVSVEIVNLAES